eukprot:g44771.t1
MAIVQLFRVLRLEVRRRFRSPSVHPCDQVWVLRRASVFPDFACTVTFEFSNSPVRALFSPMTVCSNCGQDTSFIRSGDLAFCEMCGHKAVGKVDEEWETVSKPGRPSSPGSRPPTKAISPKSATKASQDFAALSEKIRREVLAEVNAEQKILEQEFATVSKQLEAAQAAETQLHDELQKVLSQYEHDVEELRAANNSATSRIELLEMEVASSQGRVRELEGRHRNLTENAQRNEQAARQQSELAEEETRKRTELEAQLNDALSQFNALREQAQAQLEAAKQHYLDIQHQLRVKTDTLEVTQTELETARRKLASTESRAAQQDQELKRLGEVTQFLENSNQKLQADLTATTKALSEVTAQYDQLHRSAADIDAQKEGYKSELVQAREQLRDMQSAVKDLSIAERKIQMLEEGKKQDDLQLRVLKSKLFDAGETERSLREQLGSKGGGFGKVDTMAKEQIRVLQQDLAKKEEENRELVMMCDELVSKLDALEMSKGSK